MGKATRRRAVRRSAQGGRARRSLASGRDPEPEPTDRALLSRAVGGAGPAAAHGLDDAGPDRPGHGERGADPVHPRAVPLAGPHGDRHRRERPARPPHRAHCRCPARSSWPDAPRGPRLRRRPHLPRAHRRAGAGRRAPRAAPAPDHGRQLADLDPVADRASRSDSGSGSTRSTRTATWSRRSSGRRSRRSW